MLPMAADSATRLWQLIEQRTAPGADVAAIDARIWELFGERWAIMATDLSGFSRRVAEFGITHFLQIIFEQRRHLLPIVEQHDGLLIKAEADNFLIIFRAADRALDCALALQAACARLNDRREPPDQVRMCIGIGYGDILRIADEDIFGAEVNAASKLGEDTAGPDEILVTGAAREAIGARADVTYDQLDVDIPGSPTCFRVSY